MMTLVLYTVAAFGLAYILGHSTISLPVRIWLGGENGSTPIRPLPTLGHLGRAGELFVTLIECPACCGFWTGFIAGLCWPGRPWYWAFGIALYTSGSNFIISKITNLI